MKTVRQKDFVKQAEKQSKEMWRWHRALRGVELSDLGDPKDIVVFSADMINGFCKEGNLASPRVGALSTPVASFFTRMHNAGVEEFALIQEWHDEHADEFSSYGPHCIAGTKEAEAIPEIAELPFYDTFRVFRKNALDAGFAKYEMVPNKGVPGRERRILDGRFELHLDEMRPKVAVVVGNCTDLCVRELAMFIKMWSNQNQMNVRVIIPEDLVETFDLPADIAKSLGVPPHPGDFLHVFALYEMARNGIDIVREIS